MPRKQSRGSETKFEVIPLFQLQSSNPSLPPLLMPPIHRIVRDVAVVDSHRFKVAVRGDDLAALAVKAEGGEVGFVFGLADELEREG